MILRRFFRALVAADPVIDYTPTLDEPRAADLTPGQAMRAMSKACRKRDAEAQAQAGERAAQAAVDRLDVERVGG